MAADTITEEAVTKRDRGIFHLLVHFPNSHYAQDQAVQSEGAKSSIQSPMWVAQSQPSGPFSTAFPGILLESQVRSKQAMVHIGTFICEADVVDSN